MKSYSPENTNVMVKHLTSLVCLRQGHWEDTGSVYFSHLSLQVSAPGLLEFCEVILDIYMKAAGVNCKGGLHMLDQFSEELRAHWLLGRSRGVKWRVEQNKNVLLRSVRTLIRKYKVYDRRVWSQNSQLLQTESN